MPHFLGLPILFPYNEIQDKHLSQEYYADYVYFLFAYRGETLGCLILGADNFDLLIKEVSAISLHYKGTFSSL